MAKKSSVLLVWLALIGLIVAINGCSTVSYYGHVSKGHFSLLTKRREISTMLADPTLDENLRRQLELVKEARQFAVTELLLPDNQSYLSYSDLERPYAVWNVFAAEELALTPKRHCFPIAGCVVYRGYYNADVAAQAAKQLADEGYDTYVGGVAAYSTLGWFDDPLLNTMLRWNDWAIVQLIFHELSHQKLYLKNDSSFNEALATAVAQQGLTQWLNDSGNAELISKIERYRERQQEFNQLLLSTRQELEAIYQSDQSDEEKSEAKAAVIELLPSRYEQLKARRWAGWNGFDRWFDRPINNARLLPVATYNTRVPEFLALFEHCNEEWRCFWDAAQALAEQANN